MIHIDANAAIAILNDRPQIARTRFDEARRSGDGLAMSVVVYHELCYGAAASERRRQNEEKLALFIASGGITLLIFDEQDAQEAGDIRAYFRRQGKPIGPYDLLIAAQARRRGATVATANMREFSRVPGLLVTDWTT